jgi:hypothetical protein
MQNNHDDHRDDMAEAFHGIANETGRSEFVKAAKAAEEAFGEDATDPLGSETWDQLRASIAELEAQRDAAALDRDAAVQAMPHDEEIAEFRSVIRYVGKSGAHDEVCDSADALTKWIDVAEATKRCLESRAALRSHAKGVDRV